MVGLRRVTTFVIAALLLVGGFVFSSWRGETVGARGQERLLAQSKAIAQTINIEDVKALSWSRADTDNPHFQRLRNPMRAWAGILQHGVVVSSNYASIYTMALRKGNIVFGPESIDRYDTTASPPGTIYKKPPNAVRQVFATGRSAATKPYSDEYGSFVSAFSPVVDPRTGKVMLVIGVDIEAETWMAEGARARVVAIVLSLALAALLLTCQILLQRRASIAGDRQGFTLRHAEAIVAATIGLFLTAAMAYFADDSETVARRTAFAQFADAQMASIRATLGNIDDGHSSDLARLLYDSEKSGMQSTSESSASVIDIYQLAPDTAPVFLDPSSGEHVPSPHNRNELNRELNTGFSVAMPVFLFGKSYAIVARPAPAFLSVHPRQAGWYTGLIGLSLTALLTGLVGYFSYRRVIMERQGLESLQQQYSVRHSIIDNLAFGVLIIDCETHVVEEINPAAAAAFGDEPDNIKGHVCHNLLCPALEGVCPISDLGQTIDNSEEVMISRDGTYVPVLKSVSRIRIDGREKMLESFVDISDSKQTEEDLDSRVHHDALTGLPNRLHFNETLSRLLDSKRKDDAQLGVMFIDLDRFKIVNDSLGHDVGDLLLVDVADRLAGCVRDFDLLCRMGGDEFTVILRPVNEVAEIKVIADRILSEMGRPFNINNHEITIGASIGSSLYPRDGADVASIVKRADTAMYKAKELGRNCCQAYSPEMDEDALERLQLESELRAAIRNQEIAVHYQPRIDPLSGCLVGTEALMRWNHPTRGLLRSGEFLKVAEDMGIASQIGDLVLNIVCSNLREWMNSGSPPLTVALNVSAAQLRQPEDIESIERALENYHLSASYLALELPGASLEAAPEAVLKKLQALRERGLSVILDDFGTGGVSLVALRNVPVDYVKIDNFRADNPSSNTWDSSAIAASITATAHNMGLEVIAVGVETHEQMELAASLMCSMAQGYLISPPLTSEDYHDLMIKAAAAEWRPAA